LSIQDSALGGRRTADAGSKQLSKFVDGNLHVLDDAAQRFSLKVTAVHWNHHAPLVTRSNLNDMASSLTAEYKAQSFGHANHLLCRDRRHPCGFQGAGVGFFAAPPAIAT
jgi:hypothetical protein